MASGEGAEVAPAKAGGKGEERGEHAAARPRADLFNLAESDRLGGSLGGDILLVLEDEGEEARRTAVEGGQGEPRHPMCWWLQRSSSSRRCGGRRRARVSKDEQASGARQAEGHREGKEGIWGGQGQQWPQPQHSMKQPLPAVQAEEEGEARRQQTARYEALAHMKRRRCRRQAPKPGLDTIYPLEMESGGQRSERQAGQEAT